MRAGPLVLLFFLVAAAVASVVALPHLRFDHDTRSLMRPDRDALETERTLQEVFGAEDILLVAWEADATSPETFRKVRTLSEALAGIDGLAEVYSIATVKFGGVGLVPRLLNEGDFATDAGRTKVRQALRLASGVYATRFFSADLDVVAVATSIEPGTRAQRERALAEVRAVAEGTYVAGVTPFAVEASEYAIEDLRRIGTWAAGIAVLVLFALCRSLRETLVAVIATGLPPLFALGLAATLDLRLTAMGAALFPVLAVVGITSSVHLLHAYGEERARGIEAGRAGWRAARALAPPILLSLFTTAAAFVSLTLTGVPAFATSGIVVAMGLLTAMPVILVGIPAALAVVAPPARGHRRDALDRALLHVGFFTRRRRRAILLAGLALAVAALALVPRSKLQVQVLQAFQSDSNIARVYGFLERSLTATIPVDLILTAPDADDEAILADLRAFSASARKIDGVYSTLGLENLVDYGKAIAPVNDRLALGVVRTQFAEVTSRFEDLTNRRYRTKVTIREGAGPETLENLQAVARACTSGRGELTGLFVQAVGTTRALVKDLAVGVLGMTLFVVLAVAFALRSFRVGLAALLPNLMPPLLVFGTAALIGLPLDVSAAAVGAVAVGLAVDDTLHVVFRVARERRAGRSPDRALLRTQQRVGRALVLSTVVLAAGLFCLHFSSFLPTARFGTFTAAACGVALVADLFLLPALLRWLDPELTVRPGTNVE